jgi:AcrR family transcriptional regulator
MLPPETTRPDDPRSRAARTKRNRTRRALLDAAAITFGALGWRDARIEDIASAAGVSAATAYNHFPSKQSLVGHVFAPLLAPLLVRARRDIAAGRPMVDALADQVRGLTETGFEHRRLTTAFWAAVQEATIRGACPGVPNEDLDPLARAPIVETLRLLIAHGQRSGELRGYPPAEQISRLLVDLLLMRCADASETEPGPVADLLLTMLLGALAPHVLLEDDEQSAAG